MIFPFSYKKIFLIFSDPSLPLGSKSLSLLFIFLEVVPKQNKILFNKVLGQKSKFL